MNKSEEPLRCHSVLFHGNEKYCHLVFLASFVAVPTALFWEHVPPAVACFPPLTHSFEFGLFIAHFLPFCSQHVIKAPKAGKIENILFQAGQNVAKNAPLVKFFNTE